MNNTTRKHPRSTIEAFPHDVEYACALTVHKNHNELSLWAWAVLVVVAVALAVAVVSK